ncbi:MAG: SDR family NAD(P)-dependent oxidoreductase [Desulfobacteraceae bacterium]
MGALTSLVLWEAAISKLLETRSEDHDKTDLSALTLIFAGGISTCFASCFISGFASHLAAKGAKIGIQVGSAYLFSKEIVDTKSMTKQYQEIISKENETMVIGTTVGLASRTAPTDFAKMMIETEKEMIRKKEKLEVKKRAFEKKNIGSLLIGAKGFLPDFNHPGSENYHYFEGIEHKKHGNFLVGDSLAFFKKPLLIKDIHDRFFNTKDLLFNNLAKLEIFSSEKNQINDEIAVIGMGCILPGSDSPEQLWENILDKKYFIKEMPDSRMDKSLYYDPDKKAEDKSYTKIAGLIENFEFDQERFGYTSEKTAKLSRSQQILLEAAYQAVEDAGCLGADLRFSCRNPEKVSVVIATCLGNELGNELQFKYHFPEVLAMLEKNERFQALSPSEKENLTADLQKGMEGNNPGYDPVHGMLLNIEASRVARHLGIRGENYVVDAACASSFAALEAGCDALLSGESDQVLVGGVNTHLAPESFIGFCKMGALSAEGSFPFDERAGGFILGEGASVFVLKRMKDALRDKDNIHGIIKSIGSSSDGRGKAIAAPNPEGQLLCLKRCYEKLKSDVKPEDVRFIEAHGTSTIMGDQAELETLKQFYTSRKTGISSVKSQIGHLLGAAGAAGLMKAVLAVKKGIIPPNANFKTLSKNHDIEDSPLYIVTQPEKWDRDELCAPHPASENSQPSAVTLQHQASDKDDVRIKTCSRSRKAAVSSYGFGGINYHILVEELTANYLPVKRLIFDDPDYDFNDDRIVIAGLGVMLPGAKTIDDFWEKLTTGEKQLSPVPEDIFSNTSYAAMGDKSIYHIPMVQAGVIKDFKFNNAKYRMPPKTVRSIEKGQIYGLEAADEAISTSGLENHLTKGNKIGVILGTIPGERQNKNILRVRKEHLAKIIKNSKSVSPEKSREIAEKLVEQIRQRIPENNEDTTPGLLSNIISGRIANHFGLNGANYVIDASCASAVVAIRNAARSVAFKDLDFALAGGVDANLFPAVLMAFKRLGLLSRSECNFFDSRADGYVMGEGAAIHVITTYKKARENNMEIYAEINQTAIKSSAPDHLLAPSEQTFVSTISDCYCRSGIPRHEITHLDLFAFSNMLGDMIEKQVIEKSFDHELSCGNVKPQFGYFKAANPAVALAKVVLMNKKRTLLPDFNYSDEYSTMKESRILKPGKEIRAFDPDSNAVNKKPLRFASNVNGIGGNHCHMIVSTLPADLIDVTPKQDRIEESSAQAVLENSFSRAGQEKEPIKEPVKEIKEPVYSGSDKTHKTISETSKSQMKENTQIRNTTPYSADTQGNKQRMVALLSGQGSQRPGMMKALYHHDPDIKQILDRGEALFVETRGYSLLNIMFNPDERLNLTENTQPAVFLSSAALFDKLNAGGFSPDFFIGHSIGEYTALFCSGMLDFDDAMKLIIKRADLMKEAAEKFPGRIMVVFKNEKETASLIRKSDLSDIYITNKNSENQTAVSGNASAIDDFCSFLSRENTVYKKLNLSGAFHTPLFREAGEKLREYLAKITFNEVDFSRIISNVTAAPYPEDRRSVKDLLARQITSPVEFIKSIEQVYQSGKTHYIEIGPSRLLSNLLKNINIARYQNAVTIDVKKGEIESFEACISYLKSFSSIFTRSRADVNAADQDRSRTLSNQPLKIETQGSPGLDFLDFKQNNADLAEKLLYEEYLKQRQEAALHAVEKFCFNTEKIVIAGVSVGLPGKTRKVFNADNFDRILEGNNFIEPLTIEEQHKIADKNITRLFKQPDGNARFVEITKTEDVIQLAGQLGYFDLTEEYGIKSQYDISMSLAVAAGIEALKDAGIPLVMQYKRTASGRQMIPDGFALPKEMQNDTGVIITSLFPSTETIVNEMEKYLYDRFYLKPYEEFENIYFYLMENIKDMSVKETITDWFFKIKSRKRKDLGTYKFDRNLLANFCPLGSAHLAQLIRAKGPNTLISSACASTTQAIGIAEDWIRVGRCTRVIVVGGENATSAAQNQWIGSGFLALGAATVKKRVSEAAKPFDQARNGTIIGSGAVGLVIENESTVKARGMNGQAEILGTHMANSAYHTYNIDVAHMTGEMTRFIEKVEKQHDLNKKDYAGNLLFMSHETYTPARGGSADAEVSALKATFKNYLKNIFISNTKGFTGHTLGAAIEDVVMVKALQKRQAPPIANLTDIPENFRELNFSSKKEENIEYGLHLAAGFGSHLAFLFVKRIEENHFDLNSLNSCSIEYQQWLKKITGSEAPELKLIDNTLCVIADLEAEKLETEKAEPLAPAAEKPADSDQSAPAAAQVEAQEDTLTDREKIQPEKTGADITAGRENRQQQDAGDTETPQGRFGDKIKEIIAEQTGYTMDMLEDDLDLEADLGIDTVKQVEIFAKAASFFGFSVPDDIRLRDLNTIARLTRYVETKAGSSANADQPLEAESRTNAEETQKADLTPKPEDTPKAGTKPVPGLKGQGPIEKVKEIIGDQTGYTMDMLEDDLDLEADLGIDTVKQVEIFAKAASFFGFSVPEDLRLRDLNTIAKLAQYIEKMTAPDDTPPENDTPPEGNTPSGGDRPESSEPEKTQTRALENNETIVQEKKEDDIPDPLAPVKRLVIRTKEAALPGSPVSLNQTKTAGRADFKGKTFIVTADSHGFAEKLSEKIKGKKGRVILIGKDPSMDFQIDLTDIPTMEEQTARLKEKHPNINSFIHLASLDAFFDEQASDPAESPRSTDTRDLNARSKTENDALNMGFKSVFALVKGLFQELDTKESIIGTITFDSVIFPYMTGCGPIYPHFAALAGLLKTVNKEMADTLVKIVDFSFDQNQADPKNDSSRSAIADTFVNELLSGDKRAEAGYRNNTRHVLSMKQRPAEKNKSILEKGATMLVTGGAGGITYEIIKQVVNQYRTHLIILDINDIYKVDEKYLKNNVSQPDIMAMVKADQPEARPLEIKTAADRIMVVRKSVKNIEYLKSMGVEVNYHVVDVTDFQAVKQVVDQYPAIDGVFHAAGMEMSQFIPKKEIKAFERVVDVKVKGMLNLLRAMENRDYSFFFTFSSVTARFGNEGQVDYTAANDFLSKALFREKQRHPNRNYKVYAWTAWSGTGMATNPTVMKVLQERGIQFLPMDQGVKFFMADLLDREELEMVFSGFDYDFDRDKVLGDPDDPEFPFLDQMISRDTTQAVFTRTLDLDRDLFLNDHAMADVPVFLGATGIETLAEAAADLGDAPGHLVKLSDFSIPYGIKLLKARPKELTITAKEKEKGVFECSISSQFKNPKGIAMGDPTLHYQGKVHFSDQPLKPEKIQLPGFNAVTLDGQHSDIVYHPSRLFMKGLFETITEVTSFDGKVLVTTVKDSSTKEFFRKNITPNFQTPAVIMDAMFQTGGLFEFFTTSRTVLPYKIKDLEFYRKVQKDQEYYCITTKTGTSEETNSYSLKLCDNQGNLFILIEEFEMVKLNMLEEKDRISHRVSYTAVANAHLT